MSSLRHKVWLSITAIVLLLLAGVGVVFERAARNTSERVIDQGLARARLAIDAYERDVRARLLAINGYVSGNSYFKAYMAEALESGASASLLDQFEEIQRFSGADFMVVTDPAGAIVVQSSGTTDSTSMSALKSSLDTMAQGGAPVSVLPFGNALFHVVMSPIAVGEVLYGFVVIGYRIDDRLASRFAEVTDCGFAFLRDGKTLSLAQPNQNSPAVAADALESALRGLADDQVTQISVSGSAYRAVAGPMLSNSGLAVGRYLAFRSLARELAPFHRMLRNVGLFGGIALLILLPLGLIVSSSVTRPLSQLTNVVEKARRDEFDESEIDVRSRDEIGVLARGFRDLVRELREQREFVEFLERAAQKTVVAAPALEPNQTGPIELRANSILAGRYRILEVLGRGGMGQVFRAHDQTLDEVVALKTLHLDDEELRQTLKSETKLARRVTHKNIVRTFDYHEQSESQFVTMEYVEGRTLREALRGVKHMPIALGVRVLRQICQGLEAAHEAGIVHGDMKPDNVMIDNRGLVKVMDFGVARLAKVKPRGERTITGTPVYMAPEQIVGEPLDARTDLYSVGIMMFQIFSGRIPFEGETPTQILHKHLHSEPPSPRTFVELPDALEAIILRAIEKQPDARFSSMRELDQALARLLS